jgi:hypothetical protein
MGRSGQERNEIRLDRVLLDGIRSPSGRWIIGANACVAALYLLSPWQLDEVLVAFWLEALVVSILFAAFLVLAPTSGPTLMHRLGRLALWIALAGTFLALAGATVSWVVAPESIAVVPPVLAALGGAPWVAVGWIALRSVASFSDVIVQRRFEKGIALAASRFFVVYLPVLAAAAGLAVLVEGTGQRLLPVLFLAILTYYELVLALRVLPLLEDPDPSPATPPSPAEGRRAPP